MLDRAAILAPILAERAAHLARLPLTELGRTVVLDAFRGAPVRSPKGGPANLVTRAALRKSPLTNDTESVTFEFEDLFRLEADPAVIDYRTQALKLTLHLEEPMADGSVRRHGFVITPDQLIIEDGRVVARDLMLESELCEIIEKRPWYIHRDPATGRPVCPAAIAAAAAYGIEYEIRSSAEHKRLNTRGLRYLYDFVDHAIDPAVILAIVALVEGTPGITVGELIEAGRGGGWSVDDALAAVAQRLVYCDLYRHTPDDHAHARLYRDAATARAYEAAHPPSWAVGSQRPARHSIAPGTRYTLDGRPLELFLCTGDEVHFTMADEPGCPMKVYRRADFERLMAAGALVADAGETLADVARAAVAAAWAAASVGARATAHARWRAVEVHRANREARRRGRPVLPVPFVEGEVASKTSLDRWSAASEAGERRWGDVLVGLLPKPRRGSPGLRAKAWVEAIINEEIDTYYASGIGRGKEALVRRIRARCRAIQPGEVPDRKTIRRRMERRDPYKLRKAHDGAKAAYADKPYLPMDPDATPVRGLYPFQRVHYDTTIVDVRVLDPLSGRDLGRPVQGELVDAFSDYSLVRGWGFGGPRVGDLLDALVACAERYGRLPEELILDNALSHWAAALQVFSAVHRVHVTYRPKAQGRFGGPVELTFARLTDGLFHHLAGNTKATKLVRMLTAATDPTTHAVLSLAELDYLVELWHAKVDDVRIVKGLGRTPKAAFEQGLLEHGHRQARHVVVDEAFRLQTLVAVGKRTAQGVKGIELDNLTYQHDCFRHTGVKGERLDVAADHRDVARIWVFVPAHQHEAIRIEARWVEATARLIAHLRFVSAHELAVATKAVRERLRDDNRRRADREAAIADVLLHAEDVEALALERRRSVALAAVARTADRTMPAAAAAPLSPPAMSESAAPDATVDPLAALEKSIGAAYYETES